jgi:hypothetical protein
VDYVIYGRSPFAHGGPGGDKIVQVANLEMAWRKEENAEHIVRWDPARVLREVEAKRRILDEYAAVKRLLELTDENADDRKELRYRAFVVRLLAAPFSDRPGYRQEWAP